MKFKRTLVALAATGGTAAVVFGGTAVSTAFTSQSPNSYAEGQGASVGVVVDNGTFDATNLVPGAAAVSAGDPVVTNNSSVPATATASFGAFTTKAAGTTGNPNPSELIFNIAGQDFTAAQLQNTTITLPQSPFAAGQSINYTVTERLASGTGNEWNGADAYLPYTITMTAGS